MSELNLPGVILYGAGNMGRSVIDFFDYIGIGKVVEAFCDKNANVIKTVRRRNVYLFSEIKDKNYEFIITIQSESIKTEIIQQLQKNNCVFYRNFNEWAVAHGFDMIKWNRDFCAFYHIEDMDDYFKKAENEEYMDVFWNDDSPFFQMFQNINLDNIIELACGHGRHVLKYIDNTKNLTLVDILEKNINICKKRFCNYGNIYYYHNNGYDLSELEDESYTGLFTYDSMVHFEMFDINCYLKETYRVLKPGSFALFHHSNNDIDYKATYADAHYGRSFMSKKLFAYLAYRAGFQIIEQEVIDWGKDKNLDCITLLKKPDIK